MLEKYRKSRVNQANSVVGYFTLSLPLGISCSSEEKDPPRQDGGPGRAGENETVGTTERKRYTLFT